MLASSWRVLKRQPGLLAGLVGAQVALVAGLVTFVVIATAIAGGPDLWQQTEASGDTEALVKVLPTLLTTSFIALVAGIAAQVKLQAMAVCAVDQISDGHVATWRTAARQSEGVVMRALALMALVALAVVVAYGILLGIVIAIVLASSTTTDGDPGSSAALGLLLLVLVPALAVASLYLTTRLLYANQVLAVE